MGGVEKGVTASAQAAGQRSDKESKGEASTPSGGGGDEMNVADKGGSPKGGDGAGGVGGGG